MGPVCTAPVMMCVCISHREHLTTLPLFPSQKDSMKNGRKKDKGTRCLFVTKGKKQKSNLCSIMKWKRSPASRKGSGIKGRSKRRQQQCASPTVRVRGRKRNKTRGRLGGRRNGPHVHINTRKRTNLCTHVQLYPKEKINGHRLQPGAGGYWPSLHEICCWHKHHCTSLSSLPTLQSL